MGIKVILLLIILFLLNSCASTKVIKEGDYILVKNTFHLITSDKHIDKNKLLKELGDIVIQIPQKKSFLNPRTWGKPLTIYSVDLTEETVESFEKFLKNRKGFYHVSIDYIEKIRNNNVHVIYNIELKDRNYIRSIKFESKDTVLVHLLEEFKDMEINVGDPLDGAAFEREKIRLVRIAKNHGYADFNGNFIDFRGDSSLHKTDVTIFLYPPIDQNQHTAYRVGDINIYTEHLSTNTPYFSKKDTIDDLVFYSKSDQFIVKPEVISKVMPLRKGSLFSRDIEEQSTRNLTELSPYKFINIAPYRDTLTSDIYNYNIFLTPHENKWVFDAGGDIFFSILNSNTISNEDLIGLSGNIVFENRNFAQRAIRHRFGIEGTFEIEIPSLRPNTVSLQLNNSFELPGIIDIFNAGSFLNKVGLLTDRSYKNLDLNGSSKFDFNFGVTRILQYYDLNTINASWSYTFQPDPYARYVYKQIGVNILDTNIKDDFADILTTNPLLAQSFKPYLMTGFLFREINISRRSREGENGSYFTYIGSFEVSGIENFVLNKIVNGISNYDQRWKIGNLDLSEFVRFENDIRFAQPVLRRASFAARLNMGIVVPFGGLASDGLKPVVPYVKQYFVGGPNSLRGWQIRELGPGAYDSPTDPDDPQPFFQAGNLKLELNMEYRFDLFYIFEGALFFDMGNIWTLRDEIERPGAKISNKMLNQIAMSTGWGLRLDFDYFLFRFDFGYKLRSPFPDPKTGKRFILFDRNGILGNINFAINYPF